MAVFLTSSIQLLPTSSETIPLFSYFLGLILIAMFLLTIAVCYNLSIYYMDVNVFVMPLWVREYLLNRLGRLMSVEIKRRSPGWRKALRKFDASRPIYINAQLGCYHPGRLWAMERKKRSRAAGALWERSRTEKNPMFEKEDAKDIFHRLDLVIKAFEESKDSSQRQAEWRAVSKALDKLCLWIFSVMFLFILIICALMGAY